METGGTVATASTVPCLPALPAFSSRQRHRFPLSSASHGPFERTVRIDHGELCPVGDPAPEGVAPPVSQTPALLTLDPVVVLRRRQIALVTYDADRRRPVLEASPSP